MAVAAGDEELFRGLRESLAREGLGLRLAYVFGSRARGEAHPSSDLDLAVLFERPPDFGDLAAVERAARSASGIARVDVVPLEWASPLFRYRVLQEGVLIHRRAVEDENAFETAATREYHDTRHLRAIRDLHRRRWLAEEAPRWS